MIDTIPGRDAGLPEFLAARARRASDARLAADATGGFIVAMVALMVRFPGWHLVLAAASCFFAFGLWGIADRELGERASSASPAVVTTFRVVLAVASLVGALAAAALLMSLMGIALGTIIS